MDGKTLLNYMFFLLLGTIIGVASIHYDAYDGEIILLGEYKMVHVPSNSEK